MEGLRATEETREEKTTPIPTPEPAREMVASPAPISLADSKSWFCMRIALILEKAHSGRAVMSSPCLLRYVQYSCYRGKTLFLILPSSFPPRVISRWVTLTLVVQQESTRSIIRWKLYLRLHKGLLLRETLRTEALKRYQQIVKRIPCVAWYMEQIPVLRRFYCPHKMG